MSAFLWLAYGCNLCFINLNLKFSVEKWTKDLSVKLITAFILVKLLLMLKLKAFGHKNKGLF